MSKPVQHAAIPRSHRNGLLCAFCPSALAHPLQQLFGVKWVVRLVGRAIVLTACADHDLHAARG